jgi:phosphoribosylglycinamide formyltransferase-1
MINIAVFISGGGTNLQSIIDRCESGKVKLVFSNKLDAYGIKRAQEGKIPWVDISKNRFPNENLRSKFILEILKEYEIDLLVLAGYLGIIHEDIVNQYKGCIINIHPSLLPKYGGKGFHGLKVHEEVIKNKEKVTGATVHFVDVGIDTGKIIIQRLIDVYEDDTPIVLQKKVLNIEHELLLEAIKMWSEENESINKRF